MRSGMLRARRLSLASPNETGAVRPLCSTSLIVIYISTCPALSVAARLCRSPVVPCRGALSRRPIEPSGSDFHRRPLQSAAATADTTAARTQPLCRHTGVTSRHVTDHWPRVGECSRTIHLGPARSLARSALATAYDVQPTPVSQSARSLAAR